MLVAVALSGGCGAGGGGQGANDADAATSAAGATDTDTGSATDTDGGTGGAPGLAPANRCDDAPSVRGGRFAGTLRGANASVEGICGEGGPEVWLSVTPTARVDVLARAEAAAFVPWLGALPVCTTAWDLLALACEPGGGAIEVRDVELGQSVALGLGIARDDPALDLRPGPGEPDPLAFTWVIELRPVLGPGDACEPATRGRCGSGSVCAPQPGAIARCVATTGDRCATARTLVMDLALGAAASAPTAELAGDAHALTCGDTDGVDRVWALTWAEPPDAGELAGLRAVIELDAPGFTLEVRDPSCAPGGALVCAAGAPAAPAVVELPADALQAGGFVVVEQPPGLVEVPATVGVTVRFEPDLPDP